MKDNEEYYKKKVRSILSDRQKQIQEAFAFVYDRAEPTQLKIMRRFCTILLLVILVFSLAGLIMFFSSQSPSAPLRQDDPLNRGKLLLEERRTQPRIHAPIGN